ncbi:MAG: hypothetical protein J6Z38_02550 [Lachnospiraceae bacterium]|nr:hypothetical protein [Lachnospiraceae bacterium]
MEENRKPNEVNVNAEDPYKGQFRAGFGRVDITPTEPTPLGGYGNTHLRFSTQILDNLYTTCIAFTDENDETLLLFTVDTLNSRNMITDRIRTEISEALGLRRDHILFNATHTHSGVDTSSELPPAVKWNDHYAAASLEAARIALADRRPAKMLWTEIDLTGYNYVRHYYTDLGETVSVNHIRYAHGKRVRHTTTACPFMHLLKLEREGAKDIMISNWRAHNTMTSKGGNVKTDVSADWCGQVRKNIEAKYDVYFAYYQGDAGNIIPGTHLPPEVEYNPPQDYELYGREVADVMSKVIDREWQEIKPGPIKVQCETITAKSNKTELEYLDEAKHIVEVWHATGLTAEAMKVETSHHIQSAYHAAFLAGREKLPEERSFEYYAAKIGDFAFVMGPFELFDSIGNYVRANSPTKYTMVMGYSNHSFSYLPSTEAYVYGCYEADVSVFTPGTAEVLASRFVLTLNQLSVDEKAGEE